MEKALSFIYGISGTLLGILIGWFANFFLSYINEKGKNLATREDIKEITRQIESVRSEYAVSNEFLKAELGIYQQKHLSVLREKIEIYQNAITPAIQLMTAIRNKEANKNDLTQFEEKRLEIHLQLALVAPQSVLNAYDLIIDSLYDWVDGKIALSWTEIRNLGFNFINEVRKDIGINVESVSYDGRR